MLGSGCIKIIQSAYLSPLQQRLLLCPSAGAPGGLLQLHWWQEYTGAVAARGRGWEGEGKEHPELDLPWHSS